MRRPGQVSRNTWDRDCSGDCASECKRNGELHDLIHSIGNDLCPRDVSTYRRLSRFELAESPATSDSAAGCYYGYFNFGAVDHDDSTTHRHGDGRRLLRESYAHWHSHNDMWKLLFTSNNADGRTSNHRRASRVTRCWNGHVYSQLLRRFSLPRCQRNRCRGGYRSGVCSFGYCGSHCARSYYE